MDGTYEISILRHEYLGRNGFQKVIVLILRPLSDMTEDEKNIQKICTNQFLMGHLKDMEKVLQC